MPERRYSNSNQYRYGFNGKEIDSEAKGNGAQYDYGFRIYDPRISKFLSVDPLTQSYPWYTPYQFAGNTPIQAIDLDGLEEKKVVHHLAKYDDGTFYIKKTDVEINLNSWWTVTDRNTGAKLSELAKTTVTYEFGGELFAGPILWEKREAGGIKASAAYNYTDDQGTTATSMKQKWSDDVDGAPYIGEMYNPLNAVYFSKLLQRDYNAPDNALTIQNLDILDVIGQILEKRLSTKVPKIAPSPILGSKLPKYENKGQHDPSTNQYKKNKSVLPKNHEELFKRSQVGSDGNRWTVEGKGKKKVYHRFQDDGNGNWHWNGSSNGKTKEGKEISISPNNIPIEIKRL